jgi:CRISPR-associated protein Cas2
MAWVLVFFDLPVGTPEERKAANNFRRDLVREGYMMIQFSVYARPCGRFASASDLAGCPG